MKLHGHLLRNKVGRRMFFTLLIAAAVPIAFLGALRYRALDDYAGAQAQRQLDESTKYAALGTLNRLILAQTVLSVMARQATPQAGRGAVQDRSHILAEVAVVSRSGEWQAGSVRLAQLWRAGQSGDAAAPPGLWWPRVDTAAEARAPVVVSSVAADGRIWLGEVDGAYLFDALAADLADGEICVFDRGGNALACPQAARVQARLGLQRREGDAAPRGESARWNLFMRAEFGVEDWILVALAESDHSAQAQQSMARSAIQAALVTLLIVTLLSLVQIRRTTMPLERLITVTRRLIGRDFSARVPIDRDDEFGELAGSFNTMAAQIGRQVDALQVQSTIDAEILGGLDVVQVMQRVLLRLEAVLPGAEVNIVEFDIAGAAAAVCHRRAETSQVRGIGAALLDTDAQGWHAWRAGEQRPDWLLRLPAAAAGHLLSLKVTARGELLAWILIGLPTDVQLDESTQREVDALRDRIGVTLSAARRERQLIERASTDSLTRLLSRAGLADAVRLRLESPAGDEPPGPHTLLFIDLDRFKDVNDHLGHQAGDELLCVVAARLSACAPARSLLARPGGDEFVVLAPGTAELAAEVATRICAALAEPVPLRGQMVTVGATVGLARYPDHGTTLVDLLRRADLAMYQAKANGRGQFQWFEPALDAQHADRMQLLQDLQQALAQGQLELHYQPRVGARGGQVSSVEVLLRWRHPTRGLVEPMLFIPLLEESALIESVGHWVLSMACFQLRHLRAAGITLERIAVNVSPRQIQAAGYADRVLETVAAARLSPYDIELEVTEGLFVGPGTATPTALQRLRNAGMRIAIDDFGTGYSSLSYLHRLPFDVLKIDRSFVKELGVEADAHSVTHAIVALARTLRKRVVAEGVETQQQAQLLREIGCDELQGYLIARPLDALALAAWLAARQPTPEPIALSLA